VKKLYFLAVLLLSVALLFGITYAQMEMMGQQHQGKKCEMEIEKKCSKMGSEMKCVKMTTGCGEKCSEMMHGCMKGCGGCKMMGEGMGCCKKGFFLCCKDKLELTDEQVASLKKIKMSFAKANIQRDADLKIAELELKELLGADKMDMSRVEKKIKSMANMKAEKKISHLKAFEAAKKVLTEEQLGKMKKCHKM